MRHCRSSFTQNNWSQSLFAHPAVKPIRTKKDLTPFPIVDYKREESEQISRALMAFFPKGEEPAATWIGVTCLANPDFRIEIEAMAVVAEV